MTPDSPTGSTGQRYEADSIAHDWLDNLCDGMQEPEDVASLAKLLGQAYAAGRASAQQQPPATTVSHVLCRKCGNYVHVPVCESDLGAALPWPSCEQMHPVFAKAAHSITEEYCGGSEAVEDSILAQLLALYHLHTRREAQEPQGVRLSELIKRLEAECDDAVLEEKMKPEFRAGVYYATHELAALLAAKEGKP